MSLSIYDFPYGTITEKSSDSNLLELSCNLVIGSEIEFVVFPSENPDYQTLDLYILDQGYHITPSAVCNFKNGSFPMGNGFLDNGDKYNMKIKKRNISLKKNGVEIISLSHTKNSVNFKITSCVSIFEQMKISEK